MRKYVFGTGIISAVTSGLALLRATRGGQPFTWRHALAWLGWAITLAYAIGAIVDERRVSHGVEVAPDSPAHVKQQKLLAAQLRR
ncbi:hypothetical protein [Microbacterium sp. No. 7]|uniref:hypothetical protein n=1 Tax=Microbacterium sp. No. 7 TaxID=1714373 RepID=UPI0006D21836|nr:hypothetical protein [Microbacterium sp. No. 7]ALJ20040.1 NADH:ubiquinone oxidoreductase [Microbacterium sp. No. 7]